MDKKNNNVPKKNNKPQKQKREGLLAYFKGVRLEMKKVVWPTKKELKSFTASVLIICAVAAIGFWVIDTGFLAALKYLLGINVTV